MAKVTVVIDQHTDGRLIGVFDDKKKLKKLMEEVLTKGQKGYIRFKQVKVNEQINDLM